MADIHGTKYRLSSSTKINEITRPPKNTFVSNLFRLLTMQSFSGEKRERVVYDIGPIQKNMYIMFHLIKTEVHFSTVYFKDEDDYFNEKGKNEST